MQSRSNRGGRGRNRRDPTGHNINVNIRKGNISGGYLVAAFIILVICALFVFYLKFGNKN